MKPGLRATLRRHRHDLELLALTGSLLAAIAGHLATELGRSGTQGASWRRIDTEAVQRLIDSGELSDREASWYHRTRPRERKP